MAAEVHFRLNAAKAPIAIVAENGAMQSPPDGDVAPIDGEQRTEALMLG
jgi:hypothetical protein